MDKEQVLEALQNTLASNNYPDLEILSKHAVANFPTEAFGYYFLAETLLLALPPRFAEAEICLAKALEIAPNDINYSIRFAELKQKQGKIEDAQIMWRKVLRAAPTNSKACAAIARFQILEYQDYQQGLELFNQAIAQDPDNPTHYFGRAEALHGLEQNEAALTDLNKGLETEADEAALVLKTILLTSLGRIEATTAVYELLIEQHPENADYPFSFGQALMEQEEFEKAAIQIQTAIDLLEEEQAIYFRLLGQAHLYAMQYQSATSALEKCMQLDPSDHETALMLIETKVQQQQYKEALQDLKQLLQKADDDKSLRERCLLMKGNTHLAMSDIEQAEQTFMPIAKAKSLRQKDAYYGLGLCYQQKNEAHKAYKFMKAAQTANHPLAGEYIKAYLQDFLTEAKKRSLQANENAFEKNAASPVLQQLFGKLWTFDDLESKNLDAFPEEYRSKIKASMALFSLVFTEKGLLLLSEKQKELLTYRIKKEANSSIIIELLPLDFFPATSAKLKLADGRLSFTKEENEIMHLKEQDLTTIPAALAANFKQQIYQAEVAYLGEKAAAIWTQLL